MLVRFRLVYPQVRVYPRLVLLLRKLLLLPQYLLFRPTFRQSCPRRVPKPAKCRATFTVEVEVKADPAPAADNSDADMKDLIPASLEKSVRRSGSPSICSDVQYVEDSSRESDKEEASACTSFLLCMIISRSLTFFGF